MMKLENIKSEEQVAHYIQGCMNDFEAGISTKVETENHIHKLIMYLIKLDRKNRMKIIERAFVSGRSQTAWEQFISEEKL